MMDILPASIQTLGTMVATYSFLVALTNWIMRWYQRKRSKSSTAVSSSAFTVFLDTLLLGDPVRAAQTGEAKGKGGKGGEVWWDREYTSLAICTIGLQVAYLTWGYMQEKIMTQEYDGERFTTSRLLVLLNRLLAIVISGIYLRLFPQPKHRAPALEYSYCSVTNVLSSFCQYEALQYVSFPMQTVTKACKVIPTMIMGKVVQGKSHSIHDYVGAAIITVGVASFSLLKSNASLDLSAVDFRFTKETGVGVFLLVGYLTFDSFTSNWQSRLFADYKVSPFQLMLGINTFAALFSLSSLMQTGELRGSVMFLVEHPACLFDCLTMSAFSAVGQLFIYRTISRHGPVVFTIISVTRQLISIILSSVMFGHVIPFQAWGAVIVTFSGILYKTFAKKYLAPKRVKPE